MLLPSSAGNRWQQKLTVVACLVLLALFVRESLSAVRYWEAFPLGWCQTGRGAGDKDAGSRVDTHVAQQLRIDSERIGTATVALPTGSATSSIATAEVQTLPPPPFAYVFYATSDRYACSVLVNVHRLQSVLHATLPIHVLVSAEVGRPYLKAFESANATIHVEEVPKLADNTSIYYRDCLLKLVAFRMHRLQPHLRRVLMFDSDQLIMKNLDGLFTALPSVDLAAPRAYWLGKDTLSSTFMMIELSDRLWERVEAALGSIGPKEYDMDLVNDLLGDTVMMLGGEYVTINSHWEDWNLPNWYHPQTKIDDTTAVEIINKVAKSKWDAMRKRQLQPGGGDAEPRRDGSSSSPPRIDLGLADAASQASAARQSVEQAHPEANASAPAGESSPPEPVSVAQRFPASHPLAAELYHLQDAAAVIHFSAVGKPWMLSAEEVREIRPDAHPLLGQQMQIWRDAALEVCPSEGGFRSP